MSEHGTRSRYVDGCRCEACRSTQAAYSRQWDKRNPAKRYAIRHSGTCSDCGGITSSGNGTGRDPQRCLDCEKKRAAASRLGHGTRASYMRGCRCRPCTDAAVAYQRQFKKRKSSA